MLRTKHLLFTLKSRNIMLTAHKTSMNTVFFQYSCFYQQKVLMRASMRDTLDIL